MNTTICGSARSGWPAKFGKTGGIVERLLDDDAGQDIVEYALLGAVVGIAAILIWQQLAVTVGEVYGQTVSPAGQVQSLSSCMPGPDGTGC